MNSIDPGVLQALQSSRLMRQQQGGQLGGQLGGQQPPGVTPQQRPPMLGQPMQGMQGMQRPQGQPGMMQAGQQPQRVMMPQQRPPMQAVQGMQAQPGMMQQARPAMQGASTLSDERSKRRISELQDRLDQTHAALTADHPDYPASAAPDRDALDDSYRRASSNTYEYKDPSAPGAAPGLQSGPMAHELRGLPGVVHPGGDGYDRVDTGRLTLNNTSQIGRQRRELDDLNSRLAALQDDPDAVLDAASGRRK